TKRKTARIWYLLAGMFLGAIVGAGVWVYWAACQVPLWYQEKTQTAADRDAQREASDQMEQRVADLVSGLETTGRWKVVFTEEQINGWLAHGLPKKHRNALPQGFTDPRVKITPEDVSGACRVERGAVSAIVSLTVDVYLAEPNVVAVRFRRARLGRLAWPLGKVLDGISQSARAAEVPLAWHQVEADPVALIRIPDVHRDKRIRIEVVQLGEGKLYVAGVTERDKR
ncbi:MAG: hypothetical protein JW719_08865, partial [Pirellulales bacterium]|nr:hypothetical protein [Pirellulales bacterium]